MLQLRRWTTARCVILFCAAMTATGAAQTLTTLAAFNESDGVNPGSPLVQGRDGNFYGETDSGGSGCFQNGCGTVFKVTPGGSLTVLHYFNGQSDGSSPRGGLILGTDGNFYGTTIQGGKYDNGTLFKVTPGGNLTTIYNFSNQGEDGYGPGSGVIQGSDGAFYGTTFDGGANECNDMNCGTVFKVTSDGKLTTLHSFNFTDGANPLGGLMQGKDGAFYGTTLYGGDLNCYIAPEQMGCGVVFRIDVRGKVTILHRFELNDGADPAARLVQGNDGGFYGITQFGGNLDCDYPFGCGTVFKITPSGKLTTIHHFDGAIDGGFPIGQLIQATDGNLYGATEWSVGNLCGAHDICGSLFRVAPNRFLTTIYSFCVREGCSDGNWPQGSLIQATNGLLYGTTLEGGDPTCAPGYGCGTVFTLDLGLDPFVAFVRGYGKVAQTGGILGQGFTGTTDVSLSGSPVSFTVVSDTFLKALVPNGATSGPVTVTTPGGLLTSNKIFRVTPQLLSFDPPSGPVGTQVTITGVSLTQTQGVGFGNRVPAQFSVNSDAQVTATVPQGAKTGKVGIETKGGIAISSATFTVTQ